VAAWGESLRDGEYNQAAEVSLHGGGSARGSARGGGGGSVRSNGSMSNIDPDQEQDFGGVPAEFSFYA
jgi:hypothetical protein